MKYPRRFYLDTSVIGGYHDTEFQLQTRRLFEDIRIGNIQGVISSLVSHELEAAPQRVRNLVLPESGFPWDVVDESDESIALARARAYLEAGIVSARFKEDCRHVALATVEKVDVLLSWNYRHIVHYDKIRLFNAINMIQGYDQLEIRTPSEVVEYDE